MPDPTTNFSWNPPNVSGDSGSWGTLLNALIDEVDTEVNTAQTVANAAMPKAGGTFTGEVKFLTSTGTIVALGSISGATALDFDAGNAWTATVSGVTTFSVSNVPASVVVGGVIQLTNGGSASVTWPAAFKWAGGVAPTLTTAGVDLIAFVSFDGGTTFRAVAHLNFA